MHATLTTSRVASVEVPASGGVSVVDRRLPGQRYPRVEIEGIALNRLQIATALLEMKHIVTGHKPSINVLTLALTKALEAYGLEGIQAAARDMVHLDPTAWHHHDVARAWGLAHEVVMGYWYTNAESRPMTRHERAVALHLAGEDAFPTMRQDDYLAAPMKPEELSLLIAQGAAMVPVAVLEELGEELAREQSAFGPKPSTPAERIRRAELKRLLPNFNRRRLCDSVTEVATLKHELATPLVVLTDTGERFLGAVVADSPELHLRHLATVGRIAERTVYTRRVLVPAGFFPADGCPV
ncbi:hypothetical protein ACFVVU_30160 [Kitasatospora sp. NPDC057965]|uniref:hypothetical protein n=1 Tax=Kitasatospora sp. NPDC057965 TaxID=3346291 RepID=UPI0036DE970A